MASPVWVGIDTGVRESRLCVIDAESKPLLDETLPTDTNSIVEALSNLGRRSVASIALEATSCSTHLVRGLRKAGLPAAIYDPGKVRKYLSIRGNKTDINDARGLAEIAKSASPAVPEVHLKSDDVQRLRAKLLFRHRLVLQRVACEGMVRSLLRLHGGKLCYSRSARSYERNVTAEMDRLQSNEGIDLRGDIQPVLELCVTQRRLIEKLEKELTAWAARTDPCLRFLAIPGIGPICAVSFYTAIEDPSRFDRAADVGPYLGLVPQVQQSGGSLRRGRITRRGNTVTRAHLTVAATVLLSRSADDNVIRDWGLRLAERAGYARARTAVARRLAVVMLAMWKNGRSFEPSFTRANSAL